MRKLSVAVGVSSFCGIVASFFAIEAKDGREISGFKVSLKE